jgi:hypothetical protein
MMILKTSRSNLSSGGLDPNAVSYISALTTALAVVTPTQRIAISTFFKAGKRDGWLSSLKRIYLPIWGVAAPNAICMTSLTSGTFVGGVTHGAGFVLSDTTTGYMDTNVGLTTLGLSLSSYHFAGLYKASSTKTNSNLFGSQSASNQNRIQFNGTTLSAILVSGATGQVSATVASGDRLGIVTFRGSASARFLKRRKTSGVTTLATSSTTNVAAPNNVNVAFLARNIGTVDSFCGEEIGAFSIGLELTDAQDTAYSLALKNLWEGTTGLTLP